MVPGLGRKKTFATFFLSWLESSQLNDFDGLESRRPHSMGGLDASGAYYPAGGEHPEAAPHDTLFWGCVPGPHRMMKRGWALLVLALALSLALHDPCRGPARGPARLMVPARRPQERGEELIELDDLGARHHLIVRKLERAFLHAGRHVGPGDLPLDLFHVRGLLDREQLCLHTHTHGCAQSAPWPLKQGRNATHTNPNTHTYTNTHTHFDTKNVHTHTHTHADFGVFRFGP